jgi:formate hydrogenlyase transcriptional activator
MNPKHLADTSASARRTPRESSAELLAIENHARQQSDQRWRAAFENSTIGIMMADVSGRLFAANRAFRKMLGYTESELYRLTFLDITFEDVRRTNLRLFRGLVEGNWQQYQIEKRYRCKNGTLL